MSVNVTENDAVISKMLGPAQQRMQQLGQALVGAGDEPQKAYKALTSYASGMPEVAKQAADSILTLRANSALPREHRLAESSARRTAATVMLRKLNDAAHAEHGNLAEALATAILPAPDRDPAQRGVNLKRIELRYGHLSGEHLVDAVRKRLGQDPVHDGELLSPAGSDFFAGRDVNEDQVTGLRAAATEAYLKTNTGTKQQTAARAGLTALRALNVKGHIAAYQQAAVMHLSKAD